MAHPEAPVGPDAARRYQADIERRATGEPVAYIRGLKEFYGLAFGVDPRALIPRPETERLVELAEAEVMRRLGLTSTAGEPLRIIDVGTGSGAIAVALAASLRRRGAAEAIEMLATDVAPTPSTWPRERGEPRSPTVTFEPADLLPDRLPSFDLVLANLPYVRHHAMAGLPTATTFEPALALDGGVDGLEVLGRLVDLLPAALAADGVALLEIGADQGEAIVTLVASRLPGWSCRVELDLAGLPRVAWITRG